MTTILTLPKINVDFLTHSNEDWLDGFGFVHADSATATKDIGNTGGGYISGLNVLETLPVALYRVDIVDVVGSTKVFALSTLDGIELGRGVVGVAYADNGLFFTVVSSGAAFAIGDGFTITVLADATDISGIAFDMMLRKRPIAGGRSPATVMLSLSTSGSNPSLLNGGASGGLNISVDHALMNESRLPADLYDYDLVASADGVQRTVYYGTVEHRRGVTTLAA